MAKLLIALGFVLILAGLAMQFGFYKHFPLGKLPGDIYIKQENFSFYFPVTSGLIVSLIFYFLSKLWS
jgi:hypothetical protein